MLGENSLVHSSLADQARDALRDQIIAGRLKPGERIDLGELAQNWSISPTPLRDAVKSLETTGLVVIQPRRGVYVAALDRTGLRETFELRAALEGMAARLATRTMPPEVAADALDRYVRAGEASGPDQLRQLNAVDDLVHDLVYRYCNNRRLCSMMDGVRDLILWSKQTIIRNVPEPYLATLPEHIAICEALVARDGEAAEAAMRKHLEDSLTRIDPAEGFLDPLADAQADRIATMARRAPFDR